MLGKDGGSNPGSTILGLLIDIVGGLLKSVVSGVKGLWNNENGNKGVSALPGDGGGRPVGEEMVKPLTEKDVKELEDAVKERDVSRLLGGEHVTSADMKAADVSSKSSFASKSGKESSVIAEIGDKVKSAFKW